MVILKEKGSAGSKGMGKLAFQVLSRLNTYVVVSNDGQSVKLGGYHQSHSYFNAKEEQVDRIARLKVRGSKYTDEVYGIEQLQESLYNSGVGLDREFKSGTDIYIVAPALPDNFESVLMEIALKNSFLTLLRASSKVPRSLNKEKLKRRIRISIGDSKELNGDNVQAVARSIHASELKLNEKMYPKGIVSHFIEALYDNEPLILHNTIETWENSSLWLQV